MSSYESCCSHQHVLELLAGMRARNRGRIIRAPFGARGRGKDDAAREKNARTGDLQACVCERSRGAPAGQVTHICTGRGGVMVLAARFLPIPDQIVRGTTFSLRLKVGRFIAAFC
jgi:hypothetical protein